MVSNMAHPIRVYVCFMQWLMVLVLYRSVAVLYNNLCLNSMSQIFSVMPGSEKSSQKAVQHPNFADFSKFREEVSRCSL